MFDYLTLIADFDLFGEKKINNKINNFLIMLVSRAKFPEKLPYSQICGAKVGPS